MKFNSGLVAAAQTTQQSPARQWATALLAICFVLAACETVDVVDEPPLPEPADVVDKAPEPGEPPARAEGTMVVRIHASSRAELPPGATGSIELAGEHAIRTVPANNETRSVAFRELPLGVYDLRVTFRSGGVEIGNYAYPVQVNGAFGDVTITLDFLRGDMVVQPVVRPMLDRSYTGMASVKPGNCSGVDSSSLVRSDMNVALNQDRMELTISLFEGEELTLSGRADSASEPFAASGAYESSDDTAGDWEIAKLLAPTPHSLTALIEFDNRTRSCQWALEFAGLVDPPTEVATRGSNRMMAIVTARGHGLTRSETLRAGETEVGFNDLLIGPYDISVDVMRGSEVFDTYQDSVYLDIDGATLSTRFDLDLALAAVERMAPQADYGFLNQTFEGKSIVLDDSHQCIGSVPLVDSTVLTARAAGRESLQLTFDNYFGEVLELTGAVDDSDGALGASGTYRSSASSGTWSLGYIAKPTEQQIALSVAFKNDTDVCRATYEFFGMR